MPNACSTLAAPGSAGEPARALAAPPRVVGEPPHPVVPLPTSKEFPPAMVKAALAEVKNPEITRFKGLGEISPDEFKFMIGPDMRLDPVTFEEGKGTKELLAFYMGKNTPDRQEFIINNLREDIDRDEIEAA